MPRATACTAHNSPHVRQRACSCAIVQRRGRPGYTCGPQQHGWADVVLRAHPPGGGEATCFLAHRALLQCRVPYFAAMYHFHFQRRRGESARGAAGAMQLGSGEDEWLGVSEVRVVEVFDVEPGACSVVLGWAYTGRLQVEAEELSDERLAAIQALADRWLVPEMLTDLESLLVERVTRDNAVGLLATCSQQRLRTACLRSIAEHLLHVVRCQRGSLEELIQTSAQEIEAREEYDSVPVVDDIRYWLDKVHTDLRDAYGLFPSEEEDSVMERLVEETGPLGWDEEEPRWPTEMAPLYHSLSAKQQKLVVLDKLLQGLGIGA